MFYERPSSPPIRRHAFPFFSRSSHQENPIAHQHSFHQHISPFSSLFFNFPSPTSLFMYSISSPTSISTPHTHQHFFFLLSSHPVFPLAYIHTHLVNYFHTTFILFPFPPPQTTNTNTTPPPISHTFPIQHSNTHEYLHLYAPFRIWLTYKHIF